MTAILAIRSRTAVAALVLATIAVPAGTAAEVYRWTDAAGQLHFADRPPPGAAEAVEITPPPLNGDAGEARRRQQRTQRLLDAYAAERDERETQRRAAAAALAERRQRCERARERRFQLEHASRIFRSDGDGNKVVLEDEEYDALLERSRALVEQWCG